MNQRLVGVSPNPSAPPQPAQRGVSTVSLSNAAGDSVVEVGGDSVILMGVINRSPESANGDVFAESVDKAVTMAFRYAELGVTVIDVGGQSTNYENPQIDLGEELDRLVPTVEILVDEGFVVSADTFRPEVAAAALDAGAALINDTGAMSNPEMVDLIADRGSPVVLMHLEGSDPLDVGQYDDAPGKQFRIADAIQGRLAGLARVGVENVIVDPGTGISYRSDYDRYSRSQFEIAESLGPLTALGAPVLYAVPRKADRYRNAALAALAMASGASMLRIHDVESISDVAWLMGRIPQKPSGGVS